MLCFSTQLMTFSGQTLPTSQSYSQKWESQGAGTGRRNVVWAKGISRPLQSVAVKQVNVSPYNPHPAD